MSVIRYEYLKWTEVQEMLKNNILIIPVGSIEQHGPQLPLGVDTLIADRLSEEISTQLDAVIAPAITYGARSLPNSGGGLSYPGTIYVKGNTITDFYKEIIQAYASAGAKKIFVLNAHWENETFLFEAVEQCREGKYLDDVDIMVISWWSVINDDEMLDIFGYFPGWHAEHAGQAETALINYYIPKSVDLHKLVDCNNIIPAGIYRHPVPIQWTGCQGVLSRTKHVTDEMSKKLAELVNRKLVQLIREWKS